MNHAASLSLQTRSNRRSIAYALDARGSLCSPLAMREMVPCGTPVSSLMADCVHPIPIRAASFSDVFMNSTIRTRIEIVNTHPHYSLTNNQGMEFREWLQAEMDAREIGPSDLARTSKVPQPTIFRILSGETKDPRTGTVKKLERALGSASPPLEAPPAHQELVEAWDYLLPGEREELLSKIKQLAAHNREAADHFKPKVIRVAERRKRQIHFDGEDRRTQKEKGDG